MKKLFQLAILILTLGIFQSASAEVAKINFIGAWKTVKHIDEMDDSVSYVAVAVPPSIDVRKLTPENHKYANSVAYINFYGPYNGKVFCSIKIPKASFNEELYAPPTFFQYRLDKDLPQKNDKWEERGDKLISAEDVRSFAEELYNHKVLVVRVIDKNGRQHTVRFDISSAKEALSDIAKAAGWE